MLGVMQQKNTPNTVTKNLILFMVPLSMDPFSSCFMVRGKGRGGVWGERGGGGEEKNPCHRGLCRREVTASTYMNESIKSIMSPNRVIEAPLALTIFIGMCECVCIAISKI